MMTFKNKKIALLISVISIILIFLIICLLAFITKNKAIKLNYMQKNKVNSSIKLKTDKVYSQNIKVINDSNDKKDIDIIFTDVNLNKYPDYIVYQLYDNNELIHKGIIHDDIDNVIASVTLNSKDSKNYKLTLESVNNKKGSMKLDGIFTLKDKENKNVSYIDQYVKNYEMSFNDRIMELANGRKLTWNDGNDKNVKAIKIAKELNPDYKKDEYIVSTKESTKPIYMWYEKGNIYLYSENAIGIFEYSYSLFSHLENLTDIDDLKYLDVSRAQSLSSMFSDDKNLNNIRALSYWDTSNVESLSYMFSRCELLTDISSLAAFDTRKVTDLDNLFNWSGVSDIKALRFFDVSKATSINSMFDESEVNDLMPLSEWDTKSLKSMISTFSYSNIKDINPLKNWNTENMESLSLAFYNTDIENVDGLSNWNVKNVKDLSLFLADCLKLSDINGLKDWNTSSLEELDGAFQYTDISNVKALENWETNKLTKLDSTFSNDRKLTDISGLKNFKVDKVTSMKELFAYTSFTDTTPLKNWNTSKVVNMESTFSHCKIKNLSGINNWNIDNVNNFESIFNYTPNRPKWSGSVNEDGTFIKK